MPSKIEQLRYRAYELERRLHVALKPASPRQWKLCLLLTQSLCTQHAWEYVLEASLDAGLDCVQVREKHIDARPLVAHVQEVIQRVAGRASVIVNDRADVALAAGAHGVHLGQSDLPIAQARKQFGHQLIIGLSTGNADQAQAAVAQGADYCGLGPMFPTTTVDNKPDIAGPAYARAFTEQFAGVPHLAIGGITPDNAPQVWDAGAQGIAVSSVICGAADPGAVTRALLAQP